VKWKVPAWAAGAGGVLSLAVGIAVGNRFGTVLLRALPMAVLAGGVGWVAQYLLLRHLPELGKAAPAAAPESVDILIDEEVPLAAGGADGGPAGGPQEDLAGGPVPEAEAAEGTAFALDEAPGGLADLAAPAEEEPFPGLAEGDGFPLGGGPSSSSGVAPDGGLAVPEFGAVEGVSEAEEIPGGEGLEALPAAGELPDLEGEDQRLPSRRGLKAEQLGAQLDNVTQGQDPASLAKAVRTFLRKDQEG
jgi:hypothetical protein